MTGLQRGYWQLTTSLNYRLVASSSTARAASVLLPKRSFISAPSLSAPVLHYQQPTVISRLFTNHTTAIMSSNTNNAVAPDSLPDGYEKITEGTITMHYPQSENSVFYNPVQVQNRDLSVLMIGMYAERRAERMWVARKRKEVRKRIMSQEQQRNVDSSKESKPERKARLAQLEKDLDAEVEAARASVDFTKLAQESSHTNDGMAIFEALAASGLRSLRYWKEVPGLRTMVVNDLDPGAIDLAKENVIRNGLEDALAKEEGDEHNNDQDDAAMEEDNTDPLKRFNLRPPGIKLQVGDATHEMYMSRIPPTLHPSQYNTTQSKYQMTQYDVIDLDPYGSAAPFLDGALQSIVSGGLMCITCTDMAALGGSHPETCYGRYGAFPVQRSGYLQELALRILLYHVSIIAGRYGRTIRPVLSVGMAFYCRVFVEVWDDKAGVNNLSLSHGHLFQSIKCSSFHVTPVATNESVSAKQNGTANENPNKKLSNVYRNGRGPCDLGEAVCGETGGSYKLGGPLWTGPLHDLDVVNDAIARLEKAEENNGVNPNGGAPMHPLKMSKTLHGLLVSVSEELPDVPLYHSLPAICSTVNSTTIPRKTFDAALINAGYRVSAYHKDPGAVKTDAPNHVVWDVVRGWCKENPPKQRKVNKRHRKGEEQGSNAPPKHPHSDVASLILNKEIKTKIDFAIPESVASRKKAVRYALNPEANWGPKKAASGLGNPNKGKRKAEDETDGPAQKK